jgi:hypothetical protein
VVGVTATAVAVEIGRRQFRKPARSPLVWSDGDPWAGFLVPGEAPGDNE